MEFSPRNNIVKLCLQGMGMEEASKLFLQAWNEATIDFEKFLAAHCIARHQKNVIDELKWLETALQFALKINDDSVKNAFPSLYFKIGKCYEDLNNPANAGKLVWCALDI
jgi:rifampin ADP-ribosylating transferase